MGAFALKQVELLKNSQMSHVNNPYTLPEHPTRFRVFCSSKAIPGIADDDLKQQFGFLSKYIAHLHRPNPSKEFLYIEFENEAASSWLIAQHPLALRRSRLNLSSAHDKKHA